MEVIETETDGTQIEVRREETARKVVEETVHTAEQLEDRTNTNENTRTETEESGDTRKVEGTDAVDRCKRGTDSNQDDTRSRETGNETEGNEAQIDNESQRDQRPPPKPHERRSVRECRPRPWFDAYQMNQMVTRPYDNKLMALDELMSSGI